MSYIAAAHNSVAETERLNPSFRATDDILTYYFWTSCILAGRMVNLVKPDEIKGQNP
jgi:hypothetical protein